MSGKKRGAGRERSRPFRRARTLYAFLGSYIVVLLIPIVLLGMFAYMTAGSAIEDEITEKNVEMLKATQNDLDRQLADLRVFSLLAGADPSVRGFASVPPPYNEDTRYQALKVMESLAKYNASVDIVNNIYVLYENSRTALNAFSRYDFDFFFAYILAFMDSTPEQWLDSAFGAQHYLSYFPAEPVYYQKKIADMIVMMHTVSSAGKGTSNAVVVAFLPAAGIRDLLTERAGDGFAYIMDSSGQVVAASNAFDSSYQLPEYDRLSGGSGVFTLDDRFVVTYCQSALSDWKYVCAVERSAIYQKAELIRRQTLMFALLGVALSSMLALFLSRKNYKPIRRMVDTLDSAQSSSAPMDAEGERGAGDMPAYKESSGSEFRYIQNAIDSILSRQADLEEENLETRRQNEVFRSRLDANRPFLQAALLKTLLGNGNPASAASSIEPRELHLLEENGITFPNECVAVLLLSALAPSEEVITLAESVFSEQLAYVFEDFELVVVVSLPAMIGGAPAQEWIEGASQKLIGRSTPAMELAVAVSAVHEVPRALAGADGGGRESTGSPHEIPLAYSEALFTLESRQLTAGAAGGFVLQAGRLGRRGHDARKVQLYL